MKSGDLVMILQNASLAARFHGQLAVVLENIDETLRSGRQYYCKIALQTGEILYLSQTAVTLVQGAS